MSQTWDANLYEKSHSFVWAYGRDLVGMLHPDAGDRILDVGCGTGNLTAEIGAQCGAIVGADSSEAMIAQARLNFPNLRFEVRDARRLGFDAEFDAVFSNAALHWVKDAQMAADSMSRALKPGGRLIVEFGGKGNVAAIVEAVNRALTSVGIADPERLNPWYFPSVDEYTAVLEQAGLRVSYAALFDRWTPLEGGLVDWIRQFCGMFLAPLGEEQAPEFWAKVTEYAAPTLQRGGAWNADYRRLRVAATKH